MIDRKTQMRRQAREAKLAEENERIRQTEEFTRAESQRKSSHKKADRVDIEDQLRKTGMKQELILL